MRCNSRDREERLSVVQREIAVKHRQAEMPSCLGGCLEFCNCCKTLTQPSKIMKTYAEAQNQSPFDWRKFLTEAIDTPPSLDQHQFALDLSKEWVTCACGNQCSAIPRDSRGAPMDAILSTLGVNFFTAIESAEWKDALAYLERIEIRSAEILATIANEQTQG